MRTYKIQEYIDLAILISVYAVLALLVLCSGGCGRPLTATMAASPACTVTQTESGADIKCPDGSGAHIANGENVAEGAAGESGSQGPSCTVSQTGSDTIISCPDGSTATIPEGSLAVGPSHKPHRE